MRLPAEMAIAFIIKETLNPQVPWENLSPESQQMLRQHARNILEKLPAAGYRVVESIIQ